MAVYANFHLGGFELRNDSSVETTRPLEAIASKFKYQVLSNPNGFPIAKRVWPTNKSDDGPCNSRPCEYPPKLFSLQLFQLETDTPPPTFLTSFLSTFTLLKSNITNHKPPKNVRMPFHYLTSHPNTSCWLLNLLYHYVLFTVTQTTRDSTGVLSQICRM